LALTEGTITTDTYIHDSVKFTSITPSPSCWSTSGHGTINVTDAIYHSCNYFFFTVAYRFSKNSRGDYSDEQGLKLIQKYAAKFGFDSVSGVEISESDPEISNTDAVRTSIGYYHNFAPIQIARYATTIANSGTCYNLTLIDSVKTKDGSVVFENEPSVYNTLDEVAESSWNAVHQGMYKVVNSSSSLRTVFRGLSVTVAGKTGTAQVSLNQPNNALFISYAPYSDPEVCVTVVLPNGYKSANAAATAAEFYKFYFDGTNADNLLSGNVYAGEAENIDVGD
jgi:penicillin-binding protein 2